MSYFEIINPFSVLLQLLYGNVNANRDVVKRLLSPPIYTRYVRIIPKTYSGSKSLRVELYGCPPRPGDKSFWLQNSLSLSFQLVFIHLVANDNTLSKLQTLKN